MKVIFVVIDLRLIHNTFSNVMLNVFQHLMTFKIYTITNEALN
ncbi:hypothetical protein [Formosa algae]|nr:hypothetical protein [Formosa algae]